jgi:Family of unknown function (DUF5681)
MKLWDDDQSPQPDNEYRVGYRKPPQHSRFKPGQSGNPRGKPLGAKNSATLLKQALLASVRVKQNGRETKTTKLRVIVMRLVSQAVQGDYAAIRLLLQYGLERELKESDRQNRGLSAELVAMMRRELLGSSEEPYMPGSGEKPQDTSQASADPAPNHWLEYQIGYGQPPLHSRFQKGRSGNPAGRPTMPKSFRTLILRLLDEKVSFTENGQKQTGSRRHVIFTRMVNKAALGDVRFQALLLQCAPTNLTLRPRRGLPKNAEQIIRKGL